MYMEPISKSIEQVKFELYCREIAVRLNSYHMLEFLPDDKGEPQPFIWCGNTFIDESDDPEDNWLFIAWDELPLIAELYEKLGEEGIFCWPAYQSQAEANLLKPEVREVMPQAMDIIVAYVNRDNPSLQRPH